MIIIHPNGIYSLLTVKFWLGTSITHMMLQPVITQVQGYLKWHSLEYSILHDPDLCRV